MGAAGSYDEGRAALSFEFMFIKTGTRKDNTRP